MRIVLFDDYARADEVTLDMSMVKIHRLTAPGPLLNASYELLLRVFNPAVVDSKDTYIRLLSPDGLLLDGFPAICLAAAIDHRDVGVVVGFVSASLMWIDEDAKQVQLAIGNIAASERAKAKGLSGVGSALWHEAVEIGTAEAKQREGRLLYSVAEAESDSLGFWIKRGYLWPEGVQYLQPPLEFDEEGRPVHEVVSETFVVCPLNEASTAKIDSDVVRKIVRAIYRNWCIEPNRRKLPATAIRKVEELVMGRVYPQVARTIPDAGEVRLVMPPLIAERVHR